MSDKLQSLLVSSAKNEHLSPREKQLAAKFCVDKHVPVRPKAPATIKFDEQRTIWKEKYWSPA